MHSSSSLSLFDMNLSRENYKNKKNNIWLRILPLFCSNHILLNVKSELTKQTNKQTKRIPMTKCYVISFHSLSLFALSLAFLFPSNKSNANGLGGMKIFAFITEVCFESKKKLEKNLANWKNEMKKKSISMEFFYCQFRFFGLFISFPNEFFFTSIPCRFQNLFPLHKTCGWLVVCFSREKTKNPNKLETLKKKRTNNQKKNQKNQQQQKKTRKNTKAKIKTFQISRDEKPNSYLSHNIFLISY